MATITLTIPDAIYNRVVDDLCTLGYWKAADGAKPAFAKLTLAKVVRRIAAQVETQSMTPAAAQAAMAGIEAAMVGIV